VRLREEGVVVDCTSVHSDIGCSSAKILIYDLARYSMTLLTLPDLSNISLTLIDRFMILIIKADIIRSCKIEL
jgi:hypothetical protein